MKERLFMVTPDDVETQVLTWGVFQWMNCPAVTGTDKLTLGKGVIEPGGGHTRHNHPGVEEVIYFIKGQSEQTIETPDGTLIKKTLKGGDMISIPPDCFHSTINTGEEMLEFLAIYEKSGIEVALAQDPACKIIPAKNS